MPTICFKALSWSALFNNDWPLSRVWSEQEINLVSWFQPNKEPSLFSSSSPSLPRISNSKQFVKRSIILRGKIILTCQASLNFLKTAMQLISSEKWSKVFQSNSYSLLPNLVQPIRMFFSIWWLIKMQFVSSKHFLV